MLKKLAHILGPVVLAFMLVLGIISLTPISNNKHHLAQEKRSATALTPLVFKSQILKEQALTDHKQHFVPFFGSSEWSRMDALHPAVLAEKYHRSYRPFLLGQKGSQSISQFLGMQQIKQPLTNQKAVFVISPQWFTKKGSNPAAVKYYFSTSQALIWLQSAGKTEADQYAAKRLLQMNISSGLTGYLQKIATGKQLSNFEQQKIKLELTMLKREDALFSGIKLANNYQKKILPKLTQLPAKYDVDVLNQVASELAQKSTTNNQFAINNKFYHARIAKNFKFLRNSQGKFNYTKSPEYGDLELVLQQFAQTKTNVLFIIPPVNQKWADYTGLNMQMYHDTVKKIRYQLKSQGFNQIADFSNDGATPYFMEDTIHVGWRGWVAYDQAINKFLTTNHGKPSYHLDNYFFSKAWTTMTPTTDLDSEFN